MNVYHLREHFFIKLPVLHRWLWRRSTRQQSTTSGKR